MAQTKSRVRVIVLAAYLVLLAVVCMVALAGGSVLLIIVAVAISAIPTLHSRMSLSSSLAVLLVVSVWTVLLVLVVARYTGVPALPLILLVGLTAGALCAVYLFRRTVAFTRTDAIELGFSGAGGVVWCGVILAAAIIPIGSPISWSMTGDAANNVLFARRLIEEGGVSLGVGANPVPLTAALIALFTLPAAFHGPSVGDEILALAQMWSFSIVAACVMSGALALSLVKKRTGMALLGVALASTVPLTWLVLAGPVLLGFVNFHLTLALICASLVALTQARRALAASLVTVALSLAAVLALWAPLAGIPGVALVILLVTYWRRVLELRRTRLLLVAIAMMQPLALFLVLSLPSLFAQSDVLQDALGAVFEFPKTLPVVLVVAAIVLGVLHAKVSGSFDAARILIAVLGGGGTCLAALLWLRRNEESLWSYYQLKLLWLLIAILMIVCVSIGLAMAAAVGRHSARSALAALSVLAVIVGVGEYARATVPTFSNDPAAMRNPMVSMLTGKFFSIGTNDRIFHRVDELTRGDDQTILWRSSDTDEDWILFWIIQMSAESIDDVKLRNYAYYHDSGSIDDMCTIRELMGAPVTVITAAPEVVAQAQEACADLGPVILRP